MPQQTDVAPKLKTKTKPKVEQPQLWKVILLNDDSERVGTLSHD